MGLGEEDLQSPDEADPGEGGCVLASFRGRRAAGFPTPPLRAADVVERRGEGVRF